MHVRRALGQQDAVHHDGGDLAQDDGPGLRAEETAVSSGERQGGRVRTASRTIGSMLGAPGGLASAMTPRSRGPEAEERRSESERARRKSEADEGGERSTAVGRPARASRGARSSRARSQPIHEACLAVVDLEAGAFGGVEREARVREREERAPAQDSSRATRGSAQRLALLAHSAGGADEGLRDDESGGEREKGGRADEALRLVAAELTPSPRSHTLWRSSVTIHRPESSVKSTPSGPLRAFGTSERRR